MTRQRVLAGFGVGLLVVVLLAAAVLGGFHWQGKRELARAIAELEAAGDPVWVETNRVGVVTAKEAAFNRAAMNLVDAVAGQRTGSGSMPFRSFAVRSTSGVMVAWRVPDAVLQNPTAYGVKLQTNGQNWAYWESTRNGLTSAVLPLLEVGIPEFDVSPKGQNVVRMRAVGGLVAWGMTRAHAREWKDVDRVREQLFCLPQAMLRGNATDSVSGFAMLEFAVFPFAWGLVEDPATPDAVREKLAHFPRPSWYGQALAADRRRERRKLLEVLLTLPGSSRDELMGEYYWPAGAQRTLLVDWHVRDAGLSSLISKVNDGWNGLRRTLWIIGGRDKYAARWLRASRAALSDVARFQLNDWRTSPLVRAEFESGATNHFENDGSFFAGVTAPPVPHIRACLRTDTQAVLLLTANAIRRFERREGRLPERLSQLVPDFLDAEITDPMSGGPLHYRMVSPGGFELYSVGWNGTDDGGQKDFRQRDDIAWECAVELKP